MSVSLDIGSASTDRVVVVMAGHDTATGTSLTGVTVDGKNCNLVRVASNASGPESYQEMWYCDEDDLGASKGVVTVAIASGTSSGWGFHAHLYTGVAQAGPTDSGILDTGGDQTVTVAGMDVAANGLVVMGAANGTGGMTVDTWTSPLTEREDGFDPAGADLASASGTESSAQTNKSYSATWSLAPNRNAGIVAAWPVAGGVDTAAPTPSPMTFATAPNDASTTSVSMTATTASDATTPVSYLFTFAACTANGGTGGTTSAWQTGTGYTDSVLQVNQCYGYTVTARDAVGTPNTGAASAKVEAYTTANAPAVPVVGTPTVTTLTVDNAPNANPAITTFALAVDDDGDGSIFNVTNYVQADGTIGASAVWQTEATWGAQVVTGLTPSTLYRFKAKARNGNNDETTFSTVATGTTAANSAAATPTLAETPAFANLLTFDTTPALGTFSTTDPDGDALEYDIQWDEDVNFGTPVTNNSADFATNGFTAATFASGANVSYTVQGGEALTNGQTYWWRVRARDPSGTNTWTGYSAARSVTIDTSLTLEQWSQTTGDQFGTGTLTNTETTAGGVKVSGW